MRGVLSRNVPDAVVLEGTGERLPLDDGSADGILVSSAWHWMDVEPTLAEAARVLRPRGLLGVVWAGPDWMDPWFVGLREFVERDASYAGLLASLVDQVIAEDSRALTIPVGSPFEPPEHTEITWTTRLTAHQLVGMVSTLSSVILLADEQRSQVLDDVRRLLDEQAGLAGDRSAELQFRADCWRATRSRH